MRCQGQRVCILVHFNILLPIGISFFVFEAMSYCIDVYRGKLRPYSNWQHFALFIFFFPWNGLPAQ